MSTRDYARGGGSLRHLYDDDDDDDMPTTPSASSHYSWTIFDHSPKNEERSEPRRSLRKSIAFALASPVRVAKKERFTLTSPRRLSRTMRNSLNKTGESARNLLVPKKEPLTWRDELDLPPNTTKEEAMAILLCRELELMDI
jgi:hypothetical protein